VVSVPFPTDFFAIFDGPSTKGRIFTHCYNGRIKKDGTKNPRRVKAGQNLVARYLRTFPIRTFKIAPFDLPQTRRSVI
jgi:hypothetical protein